MGIRNSIKCDYCNENDYIEHFFWSCSKIKRIWKATTDFIYTKTEKVVNLSDTDVLFGFQPEHANKRFVKFVNLVILIAKMVVSKFKYGTPYDIVCMLHSEIEIRKHHILPLVQL